jgi:hypothetical protein
MVDLEREQSGMMISLPGAAILIGKTEEDLEKLQFAVKVTSNDTNGVPEVLVVQVHRMRDFESKTGRFTL